MVTFPAMSLTPGTLIESYEILGAIGSGGMGQVYRARDTVLGREVAIKILPPEVTSDTGRLARFQQEARLASALNHPNIVTIYGVGKHGDVSYIAMELVKGKSLAQLLNAGPLSVDQVLDIAIQTADGLAKAHEAGIVHRDLKPQNLMMNDDGLVKIVDFGLSKMEDTATFGPSTPTAVGVTSPGTVLGTAQYMSPEQVRGAAVDFRSDQFSFATVLYELLSGKSPFMRETAVQAMSAIIEADPALIADVKPTVPADLERVIHRCLSKNPDHRFASTRDLLRELQDIRQSAGFSKTRSRIVAPQRMAKRRGRSLVLLAACLILSIAVVAVVLMKPWKSDFNIESLPAEKKVAILPFTSVQSDAANQAFSDGLLETITNKLIQVERTQKGLRIIPASEVRRQNVTTPTAARDAFGVTLVITGDVNRSAESLRLTFNLIDAPQVKLRRSRSINVQMDDTRAMQDGLIVQVAEMLELPVPAETRALLAAGGTNTSLAYESYLQGRGHLTRYERIENVDQAIAAFKTALQRDERYALAYAGLCEALWRKDDLKRNPDAIQEARENCKRGIELDTSSPTVHVAMAILQNATGNYEDAAHESELALMLDPVNADAFRELGRAYQQLGKSTDAENVYKRAIAARPDDFSMYSNLGAFYYRIGKYSEAAEQFREVVRLTPDNYRAYSNLGGVYFYLKRYDEATETLQKSLDLQPTSRAYSNLGTIQYNQTKYADAARNFERAIKLNERDYELWRNLAETYRWIPADKDKAKDAYTKAAELGEERRRVNPRDGTILKNLAEIYARIGNRSAALPLLEQAIKSSPTDVNVMMSAASIYDSLHDRNKALEWVGKALRNGYPIEKIDSDPQLADLRADPRFQTLRQY